MSRPVAAEDPGQEKAQAFGDAVASVLADLQPGEVIAYGEVAVEAGRPGAARAVGRLLATSGATGVVPDSVAWWRVVNAHGRLAPGKEAEQARRLALEGVACVQRTSGWYVVRGSASRTP